MNIPIKNIMTTEVITVQPNDLMMMVKEIFDANKFHHIPVVDESGSLVGMISRHDYNIILTRLSIFKNSRTEADNQKIMRALLVEDVMTQQVTKLRPKDSIFKAVEIFKENLFHAVPIVDDENLLLGLLSTFDLLNYAFDEKRTSPLEKILK